MSTTSSVQNPVADAQSMPRVADSSNSNAAGNDNAPLLDNDDKNGEPSSPRVEWSGENEPTDIEPMDHWHGLVIAGLVLVVQFSVFGISNSYSNFASELKKDESLGKPSASDVSLPNAVMNGLAPAISIFAGALTDSIGPKPVLAGATLMMAAGSFLGSFAESTAALVVLYGIPCGFGMASLSSPSAVALTSWLKERLPLGVGIAYAGSGVGSSIVVAVAGVMAESTIGWRASFRLLALFAIFGFVAALFIRPRRGHKHKPKIQVKGRWFEVIWFLKQLFCSKVFILMFIAAAFFSFSMFAIFYVVVPFAAKFGDLTTLSPYVDYKLITVVSASTLFTFLGVARGVTSVFGGALATKTDPTYVYALGCALTALAISFWSICTEYWHLAIICTVLGSSIALIFASFPAMAARSFAGPHAGLAVGLTMCGYSVGGFSGPPVVLAITSKNNENFTSAFVIMTWCCIIAGSIVLFFLRGDIKQQWFATEEALTEASSPLLSPPHPNFPHTTDGDNDGVEEEKKNSSSKYGAADATGDAEEGPRAASDTQE